MTIPNGIIELAIAGVVGFFVKQLYAAIEDLKKRIEKSDDKFTGNDREHYKSISDIGVEIARIESKIECMKEKK